MKKMQKGFTLIELLVVIAIIGILAAVVMSSVTNSKTKARTAAFKREVKSQITPLSQACFVGNIVVGDISTASTFTPATAFATIVQSCGSSGQGTWSMTFTATNNASASENVAACNQNTCTFS